MMIWFLIPELLQWAHGALPVIHFHFLICRLLALKASQPKLISTFLIKLHRINSIMTRCSLTSKPTTRQLGQLIWCPMARTILHPRSGQRCFVSLILEVLILCLHRSSKTGRRIRWPSYPPIIIWIHPENRNTYWKNRLCWLQFLFGFINLHF